MPITRPLSSALVLARASVCLAADLLNVDFSAGGQIAWTAENFDTGNIHDNAINNERLVVPAGISFVMLGFTLRLSGIPAAQSLRAEMRKNAGGSYPGFLGVTHYAGAFSPSIGGVTICPVVPGDYFDIRLTSTDNAIDISATSNFWMQALG